MSNPLAQVLEKQYLYAFSNSVVNGEVQQIRQRTRYLVSFKRVKTIEDVNLRTDELVKQTFNCWILKPKITLLQLDSILGFGVNNTLDYMIISREQSVLKPINKVFGVRCVCEKVN